MLDAQIDIIAHSKVFGRSLNIDAHDLLWHLLTETWSNDQHVRFVVIEDEQPLLEECCAYLKSLLKALLRVGSNNEVIRKPNHKD